MRCIWLLGFVLLVSVSTCVAKDLIVGTTHNARLVHQHMSVYMAIPFTERVQDMFYADPSQQIIKVINNSKTSTTQFNNAILNNTISINIQMFYNGTDETVLHIRKKRQVGSGAGKFTEAAKMPQIKVLRLFLQLFRNLWATSYVGGSGPFHPDNVKPVLYLFKDKIMQFFFPDVGEEHVKKSH